MSALWKHSDAAKATSGKAVGSWSVNGLSIDTRSLQHGDLFVPLKDVRDGHDFIPLALEKGAAAVISEREMADVPALVVKDSLQALTDLAHAARDRSNATRIAVTGSVGKTSVKEMIATICRAAGKTHASIKSYNNHWGVPLTLAGMPQGTEYGVFEMGMNHAGELAELSQIVEPNIALITKVAAAHMAHFESIDDIARAKAEIFKGLTTALTNKGTAILPADSPHFNLLKSLVEQQHPSARILSFGHAEGADAGVLSAQPTTNGSVAQMNILGKDVTVKIPMVGAHWVENTACALLACVVAGVEHMDAVRAVETQEDIAGRGLVFGLSVMGKNVILIDESYNANPESMGAAIAALGLYGGRKVAVLGDMLELGAGEAALHANMLAPLMAAKIDTVITCGARMRALDKVLPSDMNGGWYRNHETAFVWLASLLKDGDTLMIKGSNASGMGKLVAALKSQYLTKDLAHAI